MSNVQIPNLTPAIAINGTEQIEAVQAGSSVRVTTQQIASFAAGITAHCRSSAAGALQAGSQNVASVTKDSTGNYTITFLNTYLSANYTAVAGLGDSAGLGFGVLTSTQTTTTLLVKTFNTTTAAAANVSFSVQVSGG